jgi:Tetratricopeptide repeat
MDVAQRLRLAGGPGSEVVGLARWVCLASRIEPHLLRRARLRFMARTSASLEADLWFGPLVQTRGARFITFYPDILNHLRQEIAQNAATMTSAWQLVREAHGYLPELVRLEEELVWLAVQDGPQRERQLDEQLRPVLKALLNGERKGLARWAVGALPRLPASAQTETARLVHMVSEAQLYGGWMQLLEPDGETGEALSEEARTLLFQSMERVEAGIQLFGDRLEVSEPPADGAQLIRIPATNPRMIDLSWTANGGAKEARLTWPRPDSAPTQKVNEPQRANALLRQVEPPLSLTTIAGDRFRVVSQRAVVEQMNEKAKAFLVSLFDNGMRPAGVGVLIDERHIITTEHNILQSYAGTEFPIVRDETLIRIRFPLLQDQRSIVARNLRSTASDTRFPNLENLALLELVDPLPAGAHPAQLGNLTEPSGRSLVGFAESLQKPDGNWARFDLLASAGDYSALAPHANIALADYSGSPLIDSESGEVFGIFCLREKSLAVLRPVPEDFLRDESTVDVFCSYVDSDVEMLEQMGAHLRPLKNERLITLWDERRLPMGMDSLTRRNQIDERLYAAQIILLLISDTYLYSGKLALEANPATRRNNAGEARTIPIILRPCEWQRTPFYLLRALPDGARPVSEWPDPEAAFANIAAGIRKAVEQVKQRPTAQPAPTAPPDIPRYLNPPLRIREIGRRLAAGSFRTLMAQIGPQETLFGLYSNQVRGRWQESSSPNETPVQVETEPHEFPVAAHIDSAARFDELQKFDSIEYYAAPADRLRESSVADAPKKTVINLPYESNLAFTGRDDVMNELFTNFVYRGDAPKPQILYGLDGTGKTSIALEYTYRHLDHYDLVWWIRAESGETIAEDYISLAKRLNLADDRAVNDHGIVIAAKKWLGEARRWLLIFDDAPDAETVYLEYLPPQDFGHVLITSRNTHFRDVAGALPVNVFSVYEAVAFLLRQTGEHDEAVAQQLAAALGYLPLALDQAALYIRGAKITIADYLELLKTREWEMLNSGGRSTKDTALVASVWDASLRRIASQYPEAIDLLQFAAFLASDPVPQHLLRQGLEWPQEITGEETRRVARVVSVLLEHSLVSGSADFISMHRLVQTVVRHRLDGEQARRYTERALSTIDDLFPVDSDEVRAWPECLQLLPHAQAALAHNEAFKIPSALVTRLMNKIALYLLGRGDDKPVTELLPRALEYEQEVLRSPDLRRAPLLNNLGVAWLGLSEFSMAGSVLELARKYYEEALGSEHPHVAAVLGNLSLVSLGLRDLKSTFECSHRALNIDEKTYGPERPAVGVDLINLGVIQYRLAGNVSDALQTTERARAIFKDMVGRNDRHIARGAIAVCMNNLGILNLNFYQENRHLAETKLREALEYRQQFLGADHPDTRQSHERLSLLNQATISRETLAAALETRARLIRIEDAGLDISDYGYGNRRPSNLR